MSGRLPFSELFPNIENRRVSRPRGAPFFVPHGGGSPSLDLGFMTPGTMPAGLTFTRASTATYFDVTGTMQTAATNTPRWDYDPLTHVLRGLLIEEAQTNIALQSNLGGAPWGVYGTATAPATTPNNAVAPDGTLTATRIVYPAVSIAAAVSVVYQNITPAAVPYVFSVWLKGATGGEQLYLNADVGGTAFSTSPRLTLTTQWQRYYFATASLSALAWTFAIGTDLRDAGEAATLAQTVYAWGAQVEQGQQITSTIPTAAVSVTRAVDSCIILPANMGWFLSPGGSWFAEFISPVVPAASVCVLGYPSVGGRKPIFIHPANVAGQNDGGAVVTTANNITLNAVSKATSTWAPSTGRVCLNGGAIASGAMATGYSDAAAAGIALLQTGTPSESMTGYIRRMRYWPRVLSDPEMQQATT